MAVKTEADGASLSATGRGDEQESETGDNSSDNTIPLHPIECMRNAFQESFEEAQAEPNRKCHLWSLEKNPTVRRARILDKSNGENSSYYRDWQTNRPDRRYHPLWKLVAQLTFGVHLLLENLTYSEGEVVRIVNCHQMEIEELLRVTDEDIDEALKDIQQRAAFLRFPLKHLHLFDEMLDNSQFRDSITKGNERIGNIADRTSEVMSDMLADIRCGIEVCIEMMTYLDGVRSSLGESVCTQTIIFEIMVNRANEWLSRFRLLEVKSTDLALALVQLTSVLKEITKREAIATRRVSVSKQIFFLSLESPIEEKAVTGISVLIRDGSQKQAPRTSAAKRDVKEKVGRRVDTEKPLPAAPGEIAEKNQDRRPKQDDQAQDVSGGKNSIATRSESGGQASGKMDQGDSGTDLEGVRGGSVSAGPESNVEEALRVPARAGSTPDSGRTSGESLINRERQGNMRMTKNFNMGPDDPGKLGRREGLKGWESGDAAANTSPITGGGRGNQDSARAVAPMELGLFPGPDTWMLKNSSLSSLWENPRKERGEERQARRRKWQSPSRSTRSRSVSTSSAPSKQEHSESNSQGAGEAIVEEQSSQESESDALTKSGGEARGLDRVEKAADSGTQAITPTDSREKPGENLKIRTDADTLDSSKSRSKVEADRPEQDAGRKSPGHGGSGGQKEGDKSGMKVNDGEVVQKTKLKVKMSDSARRKDEAKKGDLMDEDDTKTGKRSDQDHKANVVHHEREPDRHHGIFGRRIKVRNGGSGEESEGRSESKGDGPMESKGGPGAREGSKGSLRGDGRTQPTSGAIRETTSSPTSTSGASSSVKSLGTSPPQLSGRASSPKLARDNAGSQGGSKENKLGYWTGTGAGAGIKTRAGSVLDSEAGGENKTGRISSTMWHRRRLFSLQRPPFARLLDPLRDSPAAGGKGG